MAAERGKARPAAVLIAGPTASGKSALAVPIAEAVGGVVVNADSMQVYAELSVLTARPGPDDLARVPHRLYGHVRSAQGYTVARYLADAESVMAAEAGRPLIFVGGTGLYFNALTQGLSDVPPVNDEVRAFWRSRAATMAASALHRELADIDPEMARRLHPNDSQRILRALEVYDSTGRPLTAWQAHRSPPLVDAAHAVRLVVAPERDWLHGRIARRFEAMVEAGGLEEAAAFARLDLSPDLTAMKAIGVPEMMAAAAGRLSLAEATERAVAATRQYAKRQETWFRNQMTDWRRVDPADPSAFARLADEMRTIFVKSGA
jgi:tRNA dimethylallyltransferase